MGDIPPAPVSTTKRLDVREYTVAIVAPLAIELTAVRLMLDELHRNPLHDNANDDNSYTCGTLNRHNIVITSLPQWDTGPISAAVLIGPLSQSFPSIKTTFLVGIGGGVPQKKSPDIRLGDVVIGYDGNKSQAVIHWDARRREGSAILPQPDRRILNVLTKLTSLQDTGDVNFRKSLERCTNHPTAGQWFRSPSPETDILYKAEIFHQDGQSSSTIGNTAVPRTPRATLDFQVHYGRIACLSAVVNDAMLRDQIRDESKALCIEMEAAGVLSRKNCLVIRGISDYADCHKDDRWRAYAAATAASVAREILLIMDPVVIARMPVLGQQHSSEPTKEDIELLQSLKAWSGSYEKFKQRHPDRVQGTCEWTLHHEKFRSWYEKKGPAVLWITADPGCGKSVLAKSLVDIELRSNDSLSTCYFFFTATQNRASTAICALLHQLFSQKPRLLEYGRPYYQRNGQLLEQSFFELWRLLELVAADPDIDDIICILDALDECDDSDQKILIQKLTTFWRLADTQKTQAKLKFLVTSRPYNNIEQEWRLGREIITLRIKGEESNEEISKEINLVIDDWINRFAKTRSLSKKAQDILGNGLRSIRQRTYLWLYLVIEELEQSSRQTPQAFQKYVKSMPTSVDDAFERILSRSRNRQLTTYILQLVLGAKQPLTLRELSVALAMANDEIATSKPDLDLETDEEKIKLEIRELCGHFIFVLNSRIYLIHPTAKDFLLGPKQNTSERLSRFKWKSSMTQLECHLLLADVCMRFLFLEEFQTTTSLGDGGPRIKGQETTVSERFRKYATRNWIHHYRYAESDNNQRLLDLAITLHNPNSTQNGLWSDPYKEVFRSLSIDKITALDFAAICGHLSVVKKLLRSGGFINLFPSKKKDQALRLASLQGHKDLIEFLLQKGARHSKDIDTHVSLVLNALRRAHDSAALQFLVDVDVEAADEEGWTPLLFAASDGNEAAVQLILDHGASIEHSFPNGKTALMFAAENGHEPIAKLLLDKGAQLEASSSSSSSSSDGRAALMLAAGNGHERIVHLLLDKGAQLEAFSSDGKTALMFAAENGHERTVHLLLNKGAQLEASSSDGKTALKLATGNGHERVAQLLVKGRANIETSGLDHKTLNLMTTTPEKRPDTNRIDVELLSPSEVLLGDEYPKELISSTNFSSSTETYRDSLDGSGLGKPSTSISSFTNVNHQEEGSGTMQYSPEGIEADVIDDDVKSIIPNDVDIESLAESISSPLESNAADDYIFKKFINDKDLQNLYRDAIENLGHQKFIRNNVHLLKYYFFDLKSQEERQTSSQKYAVQLVRSNRRRKIISRKIIPFFDTEESSRLRLDEGLEQTIPKDDIIKNYMDQWDPEARDAEPLPPPKTKEEDPGESDSGSEGEEIVDDRDFHFRMDEVAVFLVSGPSFDLYKHRLRQFLSGDLDISALSRQYSQTAIIESQFLPKGKTAFTHLKDLLLSNTVFKYTLEMSLQIPGVKSDQLGERIQSLLDNFAIRLQNEIEILDIGSKRNFFQYFGQYSRAFGELVGCLHRSLGDGRLLEQCKDLAEYIDSWIDDPTNNYGTNSKMEPLRRVIQDTDEFTLMKTYALKSKSFRALVDEFKSYIESKTIDWATIQHNWRCETGLSAPAILKHAVPRDICLSFDITQGIADRIKLRIEDFSGIAWDWWPLSQPVRSLALEKARISWKCPRGIARQVDISLGLMSKITLFLELPLDKRISKELPGLINFSPQSSQTSSQPSTNVSNTSSLASSSPSLGGVHASQMPFAQSTGSGQVILGQHVQNQAGGQTQTPQQHFILICMRPSWINTLYHKILCRIQSYRPIFHGAIYYDVIEIPDKMVDESFMVEFSKKYLSIRGRILHHFSPFTFRCCSCSKFSHYANKCLSRRGDELPLDLAYHYNPKPPPAEYKDPIAPDEWTHKFYDRSTSCHPQDRQFLNAIPQKIGHFELDTYRGKRTDVWGLFVRYQASAFRMGVWLILLMGFTAWYIEHWLRSHPGDWSNASVPITLVLAVVTLIYVVLSGDFRDDER